MQLNTNYDDLYRQIKNMEEHFLDCTNANSSAAYYGTYQNLVQFYYRATYQNPCNPKINRNKYVKFAGLQQLNSISHKRLEHFIQSQTDHLSFISSSFFDFVDVVEDFGDSDYYNSIFWKSSPIISDFEIQDILSSFFRDCCPEMQELFDSFLEQQKFYMLPQSELFSGRDGCTLYNPVENESNVFFSSRIHSLRLLALIVHELSHVEDFSDYFQKASSINVCLYQMRSPFCEVPAFYNQFRLYEYLLKNDIYKDAVMVELMSEFNGLIDFMDDLLLFSVFSSNELRKRSNFISREKILADVLEQGEENDFFEFDESELVNENISLDDSIQYSYGPLLAIAMMDDEALYRKFSMIRGDYFDKDKLSSIGLSQEDVSQKVMKKCDDFLGKYL